MKKTREFIIKPENIKRATCIMYTSEIDCILRPKELSFDEKYRTVLDINGVYIDYKTADILDEILIKDKKAYTKEPLESNKLYVVQINEITLLNDKLLLESIDVLKRYQKKKEEKEDKKILKFPTKERK